MPRTKNAKQLSAELKEGVASGLFDVGTMIVPQQYEQIFYDNRSGELLTRVITVHGRKRYLSKIRSELLRKHIDLNIVRFPHLKDGFGNLEILIESMQIDTNQLEPEQIQAKISEATQRRHLCFWIDHSGILSHGCLLMTVKTLYNPRFYLTNKEFKEKYPNTTLDIPKEVEKPVLYLLAQCADTIAAKLMYSETRMDDIKQLRHSLNEDGHEIYDTARFFQGMYISIFIIIAIHLITSKIFNMIFEGKI